MERYPAKTLYQIVCGILRFTEERIENEKLDLILSMLRTKDEVVFLYVALAIIYFDTLILLHLILAVNKLALKCIVS